MAKSEKPDIAAEVVTFFSEREGAEDESQNRENMTEDLRFCYEPGAQWSARDRLKRQGRPCYTYNRTVGAVNRAIGDQRQSSPSCTVRAVNKKGSVEVAETFAGLIRDIEAQSAAEDIYDEAYKYAVAGAWGTWRIVPEYADDESFDQVLRIKRIPNPQTVYFDGGADPYGRGARQCVVAERISKAVYEATYGDEPYKNLPVARDSHGWINDDGVRIAEYYKMGTRDKTIALLSDGRVEEWSQALEDEIARFNADEPEQQLKVEKKRKTQETFVTWYKVDGMRTLEGPIEYRYRHIPVIRCPGRHVNIEGRQLFQSMITHSKDAQRTYNFERSSMLESVAGTPDSPYLVTAKMIKGYETQWNSANAAKRPYLVYDPDDKAPNAMPKRERPPDVPQALIALSMQSAEDIKQTMGSVPPMMEDPQGAGSPESGVARRYRMMGGDSENYEFLDQFAKAIKFTWEVMVDMIPVHYDTERVVRILGEDKKEQFVTVNGEDEDGVNRMLSQGRYDVTVTLGPAYATQRVESLDTLLEASERMPIIGEVAPDIIIRNMDVRGADEIEKRVRKRLIAAGVAEPTKEEKEELAQQPEQKPDPAQVALTQSLQARTAKDRADAAKTSVETAGKMAEAQTALRRENLELEQLVKEIAHQQAETMLLLKEFLEKPETVEKRASVSV